MQKPSELHLIVPGICGPLAETQAPHANPAVKRWLKTLSKSRCQPSGEDEHDVIAEVLGLEYKDSFPSAALTLLANDLYDDGMFCMHADPVHLQADMDHAVLTSSADLDIAVQESSAICAALDQHFHQDGLTFFTLNKDQWFVSSKEKIRMETTSLVDATGRNVNFILPAGEDSPRWRQRLTEAQMLMHSHELNMTRERAGLPSINSLWFHGPGELEVSVSDPVASICSNDDMLKGLAKHIQCDHIKVPESVAAYAEYLSSGEPGSRHILQFSQLEHLTNYTDVSLWMNALEQLLQQWVYPLLKLMSKNNITLTLYPCNGKCYRFSKYDVLCFWRQAGRKDKIEDYVSSY
ncbi:MAG: hypothetical protein KJN89_02305 [Gammaproteobacteria bacterium]|nr:hypothetical protein [Gammaproteobacteria bacterium]MBT8134904.1 hypothetical protein [Gammaproteobacteria bacterium]NNJ49179.1 hypothetical protein [Gammaproteobacteria bacterium]